MERINNMAVTGSPKRGRGRPRIKEITDSQQRTLDAICEFIDEHQLPPTTKEVAKSLGMTEGGAYDLIKQLIRKGYLKRESGRARGLIVVQKPQLSQPAGIPSLVPVPLVGLVAAGSPILAEENRVGDVLVASAVVTKGKCFALKVTGESMIGAGIEDGDIVIIRPATAGPTQRHRRRARRRECHTQATLLEKRDD